MDGEAAVGQDSRPGVGGKVIVSVPWARQAPCDTTCILKRRKLLFFKILLLRKRCPAPTPASAVGMLLCN